MARARGEASPTRRSERGRAAAEELARLPVDVHASLGVYTDVHARLPAVADLLVPALGDGCMLHELDEDGELRLLCARHHDANLDSVLVELGELPFAGLPGPVRAALESGEPAIVSGSETQGSTGRRRSASQALTRKLRPGAVIVLPLVAARGAVGTLTLILSRTPHDIATPTHEVAWHVAQRIALSLDYANALREAAAGRAAKSNFLGLMSHELKTPINIVLGYADLMLRGVPEALPPSAVRQVERLRGSALHLLALIEEVLTLARLDAGQERLWIEALDLRDVVSEAVAISEELAPDRPLRLEKRIPDRAVRTRTDRVKVRQILLELLTNAVRFAAAGTISVELERRASSAVIFVRDSGMGMAPEELERAFEPFWQRDRFATRAAGGAGLGLAVAARLAHVLGGELTLESRPGEGTVAGLELPLESDGGQEP